MRILSAVTAMIVPGVMAVAIHVPDARQGVINGRIAVAAVPVSARDTKPVDERGCEVHLVNTVAATAVIRSVRGVVPCEAHVIEEGAAPRTASCGDSIIISGRRATGWIETAESISPLMIDITRGGAFSIGRLVPSGRVAFPAVPMLRNGEHVRLISLLTPSDGDLLRQMFIRDVDRLDETVTMPAGHAIALIVRANGQATVVSQPFTVRGGAETTVTLSPPTRFERTLVLRLLRPRVIEEDDHDRLTVSLIDTQQRRPNDLVSAADSFLAIWYGLDDAPARLEDSNLLYFDDRASDIRPSDGSYVERQLRTRPTLTINMSPLPARRAENVLISQSQTLDIRIPANSLALRVFDAVDRKAVLGAEITLLNHWSDAAGSHSQVSTVFSNRDATALPPQRCGTTEIRVRAAGYSDAAPLTVAIDDATQQRSIDVPLQALHDFTELRVRLEDGTPGSGAELAQWPTSR